MDVEGRRIKADCVAALAVIGPTEGVPESRVYLALGSDLERTRLVVRVLTEAGLATLSDGHWLAPTLEGAKAARAARRAVVAAARSQ